MPPKEKAETLVPPVGGGPVVSPPLSTPAPPEVTPEKKETPPGPSPVTPTPLADIEGAKVYIRELLGALSVRAPYEPALGYLASQQAFAKGVLAALECRFDGPSILEDVKSVLIQGVPEKFL